MKRTLTPLLLTVFFAGLVALWWTDRSGVPTNAEVRQRSAWVLPELNAAPPGVVRSLEIQSSNGPPIRLSRSGPETWFLESPIRARADSGRVETLLASMRRLRPLSQGGRMESSQGTYGLDPARTVVRVFGESSEAPLAELRLGDTTSDLVYAQSRSDTEVVLVDRELLLELGGDASSWRQKPLFRAFAYDIASIVAITPATTFTLQRKGADWRLSPPTGALGDLVAVNRFLADLSTIEIASSEQFRDVSQPELAELGLDPPQYVITLTPAGATTQGRTPQTVRLGRSPPDKPDRVYAIREGDRELLEVDARSILASLDQPNRLRTHRVTPIQPAGAGEIVVEANGQRFRLVRSRLGWIVADPKAPYPADSATVEELLATLATLETADFLSPDSVSNSGLDASTTAIRVWPAPAKDASVPRDQDGIRTDSPEVELKLGSVSSAVRLVYGRVGRDDPSVLVLPDQILKVLPDGPDFYRDRTLFQSPLAQLVRIGIERDGRVLEIEPTKSEARWQLLAPSPVRFDRQALGRFLVTLSNLRAERQISAASAADPAFGLEKPAARIGVSARTGTTADLEALITIGAIAPQQFGAGARYASISSREGVFILSRQMADGLLAELRDRRILGFEPARASTLQVAWDDKVARFSRGPDTPVGPTAWKPGEGAELLNWSASQIESLVAALGDLRCESYLGDDGSSAESKPLAAPWVTITIGLRDGTVLRPLRIAAPGSDRKAVAGLGDGRDGSFVIATKFLPPIPAQQASVLPDPPFARTPEAGPPK